MWKLMAMGIKSNVPHFLLWITCLKYGKYLCTFSFETLFAAISIIKI